MPVIVPLIPFLRRRRRRVATSATPVGALTLVSAAYQSGEWVELTFGRAIDVAAIDAAAFIVNDGDAVIQFIGTSAVSLTGPASVRVELTGHDSWFDPGITLTATAANGI